MSIELSDKMKRSVSSDDDVAPVKLKKIVRNKKGIVYLSTLPRYMNVTRLREIMENFGEVGRIFLQPQKSKSKKPAKHFTEGWVEFEKKKVAKEVANGLNNKKIESRKKSVLYDYIWNAKYLSRFKWVHLSERLAYERAVRKHRMRVEITQAKKEATHFSLQVDKSEKLQRKRESAVGQDMKSLSYPQRKTEQEFVDDKKKKSKNDDDDTDDRFELLKSLFSK